MPYPDALEFLHGLQRHGIRPGLDVIGTLVARLGRPDRRFPSLHVGGTNGKGSTAAMAAAVLQAAGYRVGLYTSPHLVDFRERVRVNGEPIAEDDLAALVERLREALPPACAPTFFEFTTALAIQHFAEAQVDIAVVEVGLGGRFDATNVLVPLVAVITNVALDHQEYLGETVGAIAFEKAGIIKPGVPLVTGQLSPEAEGVIGRVAGEHAAPWSKWGRDFRTTGEPLTGFRYEGSRGSYQGLSCPLAGAHQLENAACALAALELASEAGLQVPESAVRSGLRQTRWEGRLEVAERHPTILLDGAHNRAAADALAVYLAGYRREHRGSRVILLVGMMRDKDRRGFLQTLAPLADEVVVTQAAIPRAASVQEMLEALGGQAGSAYAEPVPADALARARRLAAPEDLICVTGSLMLVGDVKALLRGCGLSPIRG
jgi:dihydrofolate synthase/folylpolyglutamate synthase